MWLESREWGVAGRGKGTCAVVAILISGLEGPVLLCTPRAEQAGLQRAQG